MSALKNTIRSLFELGGYSIQRVEGDRPQTISGYLRERQTRYGTMDSVVCVDNAFGTQAEVLEVMPEQSVRFISPVLHDDRNLPVRAVAPAGDFVSVIDIEMFPLERLIDRLPWLRDAEAILLRASYGMFWSGRIDLSEFVLRVNALGFRLTDVICDHRISTYQAVSSSVVFVCEALGLNGETQAASRYRVNEALAQLSAPIALFDNFRFLAGRGSSGFFAGVFNPCAVTYDGTVYVLARADRSPWSVQKADEARFFSSTTPLLFELSDGARVESASELAISQFLDERSHRAEDFRMFQFREMVFSNHVVISRTSSGPSTNRALRMESLAIRVGISRLNPIEPSLTWCGFPTLDRPVEMVEKNWGVFADGQRLFLLYSFEPYVLLEAVNWPDLDFETVLETRVAVPFGGDGLQLRNSINPVEYDANHWLHIVHKVYPGKTYVFWAVLIGKSTLLPVKVSSRPLAGGWQSAPASIIYICSAIVTDSEIRLFGGLDDSSSGSWTVSRGILDASWVGVGER